MMRRLDLPRVLLVTYLGLTAALAACSDGGTGPDGDDGVRPPPPPPAAERIETNFDEGALEGWSQRGGGTPLTLSNRHVTAPASAAVSGSGTAEWWYIASSRYVGDLSAYYGGDISYQFQWDGPPVAARRSGPDLVIVAQNGRRLTYRYPILQPRDQWRDYIAFLREGEGWEVDGQRAFETDIRSVLAAVRSIEIRGSRRLAPDAGFIDRVILAPPFQASGAVGPR